MLKRRWNPDGKANNTKHRQAGLGHRHMPHNSIVLNSTTHDRLDPTSTRPKLNFLWWRICVIHSHRSQVANNNVRFWNGSVQGAKKFSSSAASMLRPAAEQLGCSTGSRTPSSWAHSGGTWMHVRMRPGPALISWCPLLLQICKYDLWVFF
jgi:hypothetical protein